MQKNKDEKPGNRQTTKYVGDSIFQPLVLPSLVTGHPVIQGSFIMAMDLFLASIEVSILCKTATSELHLSNTLQRKSEYIANHSGD